MGLLRLDPKITRRALLFGMAVVCLGCGEPSERPTGQRVEPPAPEELARLPAAVRPLAEHLGAADPLVRALATRQLGALGQAAAPAAGLLRAALADSYWEVRAGAAEALGAIDDRDAVELLIERLAGDEVWSVRARAAASLGKLHDRRATRPLRVALGDMASFVRRAAAVALGELADPEAVEALAAAAESDSDATVREAAVAALEKCSAA
jgi:HEAT repeat protein